MTRAVATALASLALLACSDPTFQQCPEIPAGGCPGVDMTNCEDPTCSEIYQCQQSGVWRAVGSCPVREAGVDAGKTRDATFDADGMSIPEASSFRDVDFVVPPGASGGAGCTDLESPDCPLEQAILCAPTQCCGCQELYVCANGGWNAWGVCEDGGAIVAAAQ
jgi:hypothetical protein